MVCQNQCKKFKAVRPIGESRYGSGQKYCSHCGIFMKVNDLNCPCCHYKLKVGPSKRKHKPDAERI
ncbi:MAG: hypothetical protein OEL84_07225 [Nitrosopumilus sp.]|nr:hypothetical protein [Nitrosopumilus sp.]